MSRHINIVTDGRARETVIFDDEGTKLDNIKNVSIEIDGYSDQVNVTIEVAHAHLNVKGVVNQITFVCPCCNEGFAHECSEGSMAGHNDPGITRPPMGVVMNGPVPTGTVVGTVQSGASGQGAVRAGSFHNGQPFFLFTTGRHTRKSVQPATCSHEIEGTPQGEKTQLNLNCSLPNTHSGHHRYQANGVVFYWHTTVPMVIVP